MPMHGAHAHAHAHATRARERAHSRTRLHTYPNARVDASARAYAHLPSVLSTHTPSPTRAMHSGAGARTSTQERASVCGVLSTMAARTRRNERGEARERGRHRGHVRPARRCGVGCAHAPGAHAPWCSISGSTRARGTRAFRRHRARPPRARVGDGRSALYVRAGRHRGHARAPPPEGGFDCRATLPPPLLPAAAAIEHARASGGAREGELGTRVSARARTRILTHTKTHGPPALACSLTLACLCSCARSHQRTNLAHTRTLANALTRSPCTRMRHHLAGIATLVHTA